ncbi:gp53-like domain-containing protein [Escherichia coli]|uniref:gp53-like domain-containing protein n=1 Tax=Escherichia coli TaxID=562 RepID=UPI00052DC631|nr:tail fiber protein [Escherichia coli]KGM59122.1 putative bacteriophage protein [Escherichia coli G3/10]QNJ65486.1 phage tail protein [Escherichia coli]
MAGTNDFKAFATDANANVTSQEEWETLTALKKGFSSGKASSAQVSKALRQPSTMAAVLGQFIANAELDALDDGDVDGLVAKLATAITTNLGLGEAAKRNVGTGANQIPDMSLFASSNTATAAAQKFPSGLILQCGQLNGSPNVSSTYEIRFPMTFSRVLAVTVTLNVTGASGQPTVSATNVQNTGFNITVSPGSGYGSSADAYYIAMGY